MEENDSFCLGGNGGQVDTRVFEILDSESSTAPSPPPTRHGDPGPRILLTGGSFCATPDSDTGIGKPKGADRIAGTYPYALRKKRRVEMNSFVAVHRWFCPPCQR